MFKGYNKDTTYENMQSGESPFARNIVVTKKYLSPSNEPGFDEILTLPGLLIGVISTSYKDVLFIQGVKQDEIGTFDGTTYTCVLKADLGFEANYPIEGTFKYNFGQQLIVAWTDNFNSPRILNLDCLPFEVGPDCVPTTLNDIRLLDLTPELSIPNVALLPHTYGGSVQTGAYWAFIAYEYADGTRTNWIKMSNTIIVSDNNPNDTFTEYDGAEGGVVTNKIINLALTNIDTAFSKVVLGMIRQRNGIQDAFIVKSFTIQTSTQTIRYAGTEIVENVALEELLVPNQTYVKAKTITSLDDRLHLGNVETEAEIDWQNYANNVKIQWVYSNAFNLLSPTQSYKDPVVFFDKRTFRTDEVYDFYGVFKLKTGGYTKAFHIPGIEQGVININGSNIPQSYSLESAIRFNFLVPNINEYYAFAPDAALYHVVNTADVLTNTGSFMEGTMGYYENQDIGYPDEPCSQIFDCDGNVIGNLAGQRRRFHRFPNIGQLTTWSGEYLNYNNEPAVANLQATGFTIQAGSNTVAYLDYQILNTNIPPEIIEDANANNGITYNLTAPGNYNFNINTVIFGYKNQLDIKIGYVKDGQLFYLLDVEESSSLQNRSRTITLNETLTLSAGDVFFVRIQIIALGVYFGGDVTSNSENFVIKKLDLEDLDTKVKKLGIRLRDICIPDAIKEKVEHLEIFYAKRTFGNSTVIGQSLLDITNANDVRSYDFALLKDKPSVGLTHIQTELAFESPDTNFLDNATITVLDKIKQVESNKYIASNISIPVDNRKREEYLQLNLLDIQNLPTDKLVLANLKAHKRNLYEQVELTGIGAVIPVTTTNSNTLYGGDTVITAYTHLHSGNSFYSNFETYGTNRQGAVPDTFDLSRAVLIFFSIWAYPVESVYNINLRHINDFISDNNYFPKSIDYPSKIDVVIDKTLSPLIEDNDYYTGETTLTYNNDFHAFTPDLAIQVFECVANCYNTQTRFPTRVARSIVSSNEEYVLSWRTFLVNDYYEMPKDKGVIWKLAVFNQALIIHLEYSLFLAIVKDRLAVNIQEVFLGTADLFDRRPDEVIGTVEGYAGCQSQWAAFICKLGYIFADLNQGKVFIFNGKLKEISNDKTRTWFISNFTTNPAITERDTFPVIDNPYTQSGAVGWYDEVHNRILFGFTERVNNIVSISRSKMLSYYPDLEAWVSEHDYFPSAVYSSRRGIFSGDTDIAEETTTMYLHNQSNRGIFYKGLRYASFIDVLLKTPNGEQVRWDSIFWNSVVSNDTKTFKDKTFSQLAVYTEDQCTGVIVLGNEKSFFANDSRNSRNTKYIWKFSKVRDIVIDRNEVIIDNNGVIDTLNLKNNPAWHELSKFYNNFIVIRFIYDNIDQNTIYLNDVDVNVIKTRR